jgi:3-dehydroquinate synthase
MHLAIKPAPSSATTELWVDHGLLQGTLLPSLIQQWAARAVIIAHHSIATLYGEHLAAMCNAELLVIPQNGKPLKSRENKAFIEDELLARKCGRDTVLIALGGGATTDLVGFVASTYLRGVPLIFIPTTLLAIVDASIGGKTSIDTPQGKNLIGSYYQPKAIISDLDMLASLPNAEWQNGLAEILKAALIADSSLWTLCDGAWRAKLAPIVEKAMHVKIGTIEKDPQEKGLRRILNFGHTVAHALESVANYKIAHGEAVAIGLLAESYLSMRLGLLPQNPFQEIEARITGANFPLRLPSNYNRTSFLHAMQHDKKNAKGVVRFTLLTHIGGAGAFDGQYCRPVSEEALQEMSEWMERL